MFSYNPKANYQPNGGRYLQILSGKDLYKQTIVMSAETHDTFPVRFQNIFVDYPLVQMRVGDKMWKNWNKAPLKLWHTQLNYAVFCALSVCGVSSAHLNYTKHPLIRSVYCFHVYCHVRRVLKKLQVPLPHETGFNAAVDPYTESEFFKICEDYGVPNDPTRYRDEKFYWSYQHGLGWPNDYLGPDSMTQWIIKKSQGFTDVGLLRISESVRAYAFLILSSQASARSGIVGNTASALTAQSAFLNNFENVVNHRVDIREDVKKYQDTLSYALSKVTRKVDYSIGESIYMLPSDLKLKIKTGTVGYNNKILVSNGNFLLGKNENVNLTAPAIKNHKTNSLETPTIKTHETNPLETPTMKSTQTAVNSKRTAGKTIISDEEEKVALVLSLTGIFTIWFIFR